MNVWRWPIITAVASVVGLLTALFFDGWGDVLSWVALGIPVAQSIWFWKLRRSRASGAIGECQRVRRCPPRGGEERTPPALRTLFRGPLREGMTP